MLDTTLQMFLFKKIKCKFLPSAEHQHLFEFKMCGEHTLADCVSPIHFDHIRFETEEEISLDSVFVLIKKYYSKLKYKKMTKREICDGSIVYSIFNGDHKITVTLFQENYHTFNITIA